MTLQQAIERTVSDNEKKLAARVSLPAPELDHQTRALLVPYMRWCREAGVKWCPAAPGVIAAFIHSRDPTEKICPMLFAIEELHDQVGAPNPVQTAAVRSAVQEVLGKRYELPKDLVSAVRWSSEEKELLTKLPPDIRDIVCRRELNRNAAVRRHMSEAAAYRNQFKHKD